MIDLQKNISDPHLPESGKDAFERMYLAVRQKEKRIYTDMQVSLLPLIHTAHPHYREWLVRKRSANRLFKYLKAKARPLSILEVGCGNGWLIAKLAAIQGGHGTGIDINKPELLQAERVFKKKNNLEFIEAEIRDNDLDGKKFDAIIFAASIQYFDSLENIISRARTFLKEGGEIHILDSFFYNSQDIENAKERTKSYYRSIGYARMADNYFHHEIGSLKNIDHKILFDPTGLTNKIFRKEDPFPWIVIQT